MINYKVIDEPIFSFIMAPFYLIGDDELLKSQLINLNEQTILNFEVIIPDPHYSKRKWLGEFVNQLKYNVIHFDYVPNTKIPKSFDYGILNTAVLISNTKKIITFQDWRFCNRNLIKRLLRFIKFEFIGLKWQVLYKDDAAISSHWGKSTIDFDLSQANELYKTGIFPEIEITYEFTNTFHNSCWGHYCIDKELWLNVNGIDEVVTNTRHYADLDINTRLEYFYKSKKSKLIRIPMLENAMVRIMHSKGNFFGGSNIELDHIYNNKHVNCCFSKTGSMNDKMFTEYVVDKIENNEYSKIYEIPYSTNFIQNNKNESLDSKFAVIGFECNVCGLVGETPHWYEKSPESRVTATIGAGLNIIKIGRNLKKIQVDLKNCEFEEKINILNNSWYELKYFE